MLTFWGRQNESRQERFCDGVCRREFLRVGAIGAGAVGLTLADVLRVEAASPAKEVASSGRRGKSLIQIFLPGGPPHMDMYDLKPEAPKEYRGEFRPLDTSVPDLQICELFPKQAAIADKLAVLRSVVGADGSHSAWQFMTGYRQREMRPALGSVASRIQGPGHGGMPAYVALNRRGEEQGGFLSAAHQPFESRGPGLENLRLVRNVDAARLENRRSLLSYFDSIRRDLDSDGTMAGMDQFTERAFDMITTGSVREAFDLASEDPRTREAYGGRDGDRFLMARRLVEAGARVVSLSYGGWDTHGQNFTKMRKQLPVLDTALASLISDLDARGLLDDVTVVMYGEFGRTPKVNGNAGRDHWPQVMSVLLAGGGLRTGQVVGSTDKRGERANDRPIDVQQVHAMLYRSLGIDPATTLTDGAGRPTYLVDRRDPIHELI